MSEQKILRGIVLDEEITLTLKEVCDACGVERSLVVEMVKEGIASPLDQDSKRWEFSGIAVARLRTAYKLHRDLQINLAGIALALDLLDEIEALRSSQERLRS